MSELRLRAGMEEELPDAPSHVAQTLTRLRMPGHTRYLCGGNPFV